MAANKRAFLGARRQHAPSSCWRLSQLIDGPLARMPNAHLARDRGGGKALRLSMGRRGCEREPGRNCALHTLRVAWRVAAAVATVAAGTGFQVFSSRRLAATGAPGAWRVRPSRPRKSEFVRFQDHPARTLMTRLRRPCAGVFDTLLWNQSGEITECTRGNVALAARWPLGDRRRCIAGCLGGNRPRAASSRRTGGGKRSCGLRTCLARARTGLRQQPAGLD